jgi:hypothetical protein
LDKKQFTSWGVSFGSLALVAGMVSYLGLTNKNTPISNKTTQSQAASRSIDQQSPSTQSGDDQSSIGLPNNDDGASSNSGDDQTTNDNGPSINLNDGSSSDSGQSAFDNGNSSQNNGQFSGRGFGHHRGFDTTTGGT